MSNQNAQTQTALAAGTGTRMIENYLVRGLPALRQICSRYLTPERLIKIALVARAKCPKLAQCSAESLLLALMEAAQLGLEPNTPLDHAALVPLRNKHTGGYEVEYWPMYKGLIELGRRSCGLKSARAVPIWNGDEYRIVEGLTHTIEHTPKLANPNRGVLAQLVMVYAVAELPAGGQAWDYMTKDEIDRVRQCSRASDDGPWVSSYGQMAKKTVVRRLMNQLPLSPEARAVLAHDEAQSGDPSFLGDLMEPGSVIEGVIPDERGAVKAGAAHRVEYDPEYEGGR